MSNLYKDLKMKMRNRYEGKINRYVSIMNYASLLMKPTF